MIAIETLKSQLTTSASSERLRHPAAIAAVIEGHSKPIFFCDVIYEILCLSFFFLLNLNLDFATNVMHECLLASSQYR